MKTLMLIDAGLDAPSHRLVSIPDDHPAVKFCADWENIKGHAYIDPSDDTKRLMAMARKFDAMPDSDLRLPCQVDMVIHILRY